MTAELDIKTLKVAKVKCLNSSLFFTRYFFKAQYRRKFIIGRHHQAIAEALDRVVSGKCKRLIIQVAPRFGKTELAVKNFIAYGLALNPAAKFIHLSYSDDLALDNSETVKDLVNSEDYQQMFPAVKIKHDSKAKNKWYTTEGGGVLARAAGGSVTGFGAGKVDEERDVSDTDVDDIEEFLSDLEIKQQFGGAIIIDDPIKPEDADSETIRARVNSRFDSTIRTRANSRHTPIIVIMQRTHPDDLAGYLQRDTEADKWEVISFPVINEDGTALWPFKMTVEEARALEAANDLVFGRQYMLDPKPKSGLLFPIDELKLYDPAEMESALADPDHIAVFGDPADEGGDDFASAPFKLLGDKIYVTDMIYNTNGADLNEIAVEELVSANKATMIGIEAVMGWKQSAERVRDSLYKRGYRCDFRMLRPRTSKHTRIVNRASFIRNNFVFRKDWKERPEYAKFFRNLTSYLKIQEAATKNKHDDAPDLCEMAGSYFEKTFPHLWALKPRT
jgi:predicted phage terminase large subunit-like protein